MCVGVHVLCANELHFIGGFCGSKECYVSISGVMKRCCYLVGGLHIGECLVTVSKFLGNNFRKTTLN